MTFRPIITDLNISRIILIKAVLNQLATFTNSMMAMELIMDMTITDQTHGYNEVKYFDDHGHPRCFT